MSALPNALTLSKLSRDRRIEFKEKVAEQVYIVFDNYAQLIRTSSDPKDIDAFLRWGARVAELEPKANEAISAPVINITFDLGDDRSNVVEMQSADVQDVEAVEVAPDKPTEALPSPAQEVLEDELPDFDNAGLIFALDALEK